MTTMASGKVTINVEAARQELRLALFQKACDEVYAAEGAAFETTLRSLTSLYSSPEALDQVLAAKPNALREAINEVAYRHVFKSMTDLGLDSEVSNKLFAKAKAAGVGCSSFMMQAARGNRNLVAFGMLFHALFGIPVADTMADRVWRLYNGGGFSYYEEVESFDNGLSSLLDETSWQYSEKTSVARVEFPRVVFSQRFARKPQIMLGISGMNMDGGALSLELEAINVTNEGFCFASVPFDIKLHSITISWFAHAYEGGAARPENIVPSASAFQPGDDPAHVVDGNNGSLWHTPWDRSAALPQWIMLDFGGDYPLTGLLYTPRQDGQSAGNILAWSILVSNDGTSFREVASGYWSNDSSPKTITFAETSARYVRLVANAGVEGFASASEVSPIFSGES